MTQNCCWTNPQDVNEGCETPASFEVWTMDDRGGYVPESDTYACPAHLVDLMPKGATYRVIMLEKKGERPARAAVAPAQLVAPPPPPGLEMKDLTEELMTAILAKVDAGVPPLHAVQGEGVHSADHVGWMLSGSVHAAAHLDTLQARYFRAMKERAQKLAAGRSMIPAPTNEGG